MVTSFAAYKCTKINIIIGGGVTDLILLINP